MIGVQPLQTVDIDTSAAAEFQTYAAWLVLFAVVVMALALKMKLRYWELEADQRRHLSAIRQTLARGSWYKVPIRADEDRGRRYERVRAAIYGETGRSRSPRAALGVVRGALASRIPALPPLAVRAAVEGVVLLVLGVLLAISRDQWVALLSGSVDLAPTDPAAVVDALTWVALAVAWVLETTVPGGATVVALAASVVLALYDAVLLEVWFVLGAVLVALAAGVVELDRRTPTDLSPTLYPDRRRLALRGAGWIAVVWAAAAAGNLVALEVGLVTGGLALLVVSIVVGKGLLERLYAVADLTPPWAGVSLPRVGRLGTADLPATVTDLEHPDGAGGDYETLAYVLVRQTVGVVAVLALPIVVYFAVLSVGTGAILGPLVALGAAPWYVALVALAALVAGVVWAVGTLESLTPVREWCRRRIATGTIRSAVVARGIPVAAAVVGGLVGWAYLGAQMASGAWYAWLATILGISLVTAAVAVTIVVAGRRAWDQFGVVVLVDDDETVPPTDQVVEVLSEPLEDGDGESLYVARVDGRPFAARDPGTLFALIQRVVDERFESGETPELVAHELYESAVERGVVDPEQVFREVRGDLDTRIESTLADHDGELDYRTLADELRAEYPDRLVEVVLTTKQERNEIGVRNGTAMLIDRSRTEVNTV